MENASSLISKFLIPDDKTLLIILVRKITASTQAKTAGFTFHMNCQWCHIKDVVSG